MTRENLLIVSRRVINTGITIGYILVILSMPFHPRWSLASLNFLSCFALASLFVNRKWTPPGPIQLSLLAIFFVRLLWFFYGDVDFSYRMRILDGEASLLFIPIIFMLTGVTPEQRVTAFKAFIVMAVLMMFLSFYQLIETLSNSGETLEKFFQTYFENAQYYSSRQMVNWEFGHYSFLTMLVIYAFHFLVYLKFQSKVVKAAAIVSYLIVTILFIVFTGTKLGWVILIISPILYLAAHLKILKKWYVVVGGLFIACTVIYFVGTKYYWSVDPARYDMAAIAIKAISKAPLLGGGTGSRKSLMHNELFEYNYTMTVNHPHNQYLSELMQYGLIGSIPLLLLIFFGLRVGILSDKRELLAVMVSMMILMLVESPINSNRGLLPFVFVLCLLAAGDSVDVRIGNSKTRQ